MSKTNNFQPLLSAALVAGLACCGSAFAASFYSVINLVSDGAIPAAHKDTHLVNGWGITRSATSPFWVANNGTGTSTLYNGNGVAQPAAAPLVVNIPAPGGGAGAPTGLVFNGSTTDFAFTDPTNSATLHAAFIFSTEEGAIIAWAGGLVDRTHAVLVYPPAGTATSAIYKGLAIANNGSANFIYASDFHNSKVDVFDTNFKLATLSGDFTDPRLPKGYAPFGIQTLGASIYVTFAKQDEEAEDEIDKQAFGIVDEFTTNGVFVRRVVQHGQLNAPWGLAIAPANFGCFSNALIVGNFGDGHVNAFDVASGEFLGALRGEDNKRIVVDGIWGIAFGNGSVTNNQPTNVLFFAAGPNEEKAGLFGRIEASGSGPCVASDED